MPKTNQINNGLDSELEDILAKLSENEYENTKSNNKRLENSIEITDLFLLERNESDLEYNQVKKKCLETSEVTLEVKKAKIHRWSRAK